MTVSHAFLHLVLFFAFVVHITFAVPPDESPPSCHNDNPSASSAMLLQATNFGMLEARSSKAPPPPPTAPPRPRYPPPESGSSMTNVVCEDGSGCEEFIKGIKGRLSLGHIFQNSHGVRAPTSPSCSDDDIHDWAYAAGHCEKPLCGEHGARVVVCPRGEETWQDNASCVFPFVSAGSVYHQCAWSALGSWCATEVDNITWQWLKSARCSSNCAQEGIMAALSRIFHLTKDIYTFSEPNNCVEFARQKSTCPNATELVLDNLCKGSDCTTMDCCRPITKVCKKKWCAGDQTKWYDGKDNGKCRWPNHCGGCAECSAIIPFVETDVNTNQCAGGASAITSQVECQEAASAFGYTWGGGITSYAFPTGCTKYKPSSYLWFNLHSSGLAHPYYTVICSL